MTKLEAWKKWCEEAHVTDATDYTLEMSSHGKAFSYAWDAAQDAMLAEGYVLDFPPPKYEDET